MTDAITREEKLMKSIATGSPSNIKPITREEMFLAKAGGQDVETPEPITRREKLLQGIVDNGGGGGSTGGGGDVPVGYDILMKSVDGSIPYEGFAEDTGFTEIYSTVVSLANGAFDKCISVVKAFFPMLTSVGRYPFRDCTSLEEVFLPLLTGMSDRVFDGCTNLKKIELPLVNGVAAYTFQGCTNLKEIILGKATSIQSYAFNNCSSLNVLVLGHDDVVTLSNVNTFGGTPFAIGGTGGIAVVPQALIEQYKIATNWSTLYEAGTVTFVAEEGSEYE